MEENALFSRMLLDRPSLLKRLTHEFNEAGREFRRNPTSFVKAALRGDPIGGRRRQVIRLGLAAGLALYTIAFAAILIFWTLGERTQRTPLIKPASLVYAGPFVARPMPKDENDAGGGGGGGRKTLEQASAGNFADPSLLMPVNAPSPESQTKEPALPFPETVMVDPRILARRDDLSVTGLPGGVVGPPIAGPGKDDGMGSGEQGGMGPGRGSGVEEGEGWNRGGKTPRVGGNPNTTDHQLRVDERPAALNRPRPNYTEQARKNKVQGTVKARALVGAEGLVKRVIIERGLPDGLNEEAIQAVYQIRFRPARKDGQPLAFWVTLEIEFNLR